MEFKFIEGGKELLHLIQPMWEKLNTLHKEASPNFSHYFSNLSYEARKEKFNTDDIMLMVSLVVDSSSEALVGYCVSTINKENIGEIDSLYVNEDYRKHSLGDILMQKSINWLNNNKVAKKIIVVAAGNEGVLSFYERYGYYPKVLVLEEK